MATRAPLERVIVIGTTGAGKTTYARRLADALAVPHVELDALRWGPAWTPRADFAAAVAAAAAAPRWVMDGNYSAVRDVVWRRATAIVWLDYSFARVVGRALRRTVRRVATREPLFSGNRETVANQVLDPEGVVWWVLRTFRRRRREYPRLLGRPEYAHAAVLRFRRPAEAEAFLRAAEARCTG